MRVLDLALLLVVPLLAIAGVVVAGYLLLAVGRVQIDPPWIRALEDEPFPEAATLTASDRSRMEPTHRIEVIAQLLFTQLRRDGIFVDTVILEALGTAEGLIAMGAPLSLRVERPGPEVLGACSEAILELWAEKGEVVKIDLCVQGDDVRAEMTNGSSRVVLEITEAAGLP